MHDFWADLLRSRAFWLGYVGAGSHEFVSCEPPAATGAARPDWSVTLTFPFPDLHWLLFTVGDRQHQLTLTAEDGGCPLGHREADMDQKAELLAWDEFDRLARHLARTAGPAWAADLLLTAYTAGTPDCLDRLLDRKAAAMRAAGVFAADEVERAVALDRRAAVDRQLRWEEVPGVGRVVRGRLPYWSVRQPGFELDFPLFHRFLAAVPD